MHARENLRLADGAVLSWSADIECSLLRNEYKDSLFSSSGYPVLAAFWLNGKIISGTDDLETGMLYFHDVRGEDKDSFPLVEAGENGLAMTFGRPLYYDGQNITLEDKPLFRFLDSKTGTITTMENQYPNSGDFKTAISRKNLWMAAAYDDGSVCIYDPSSNNVMIPKKTWSPKEILALCFSPDDAYLLLLTATGELDIIDTSSMEIVYDEIVGSYNNMIRNQSTSFRRIRADYNKAGDSMVIVADYNFKAHGILLDLTNWSIMQNLGDIIDYDPDNDRVWTDSDTEGVYLSYPLYELSDLKEWAEKVLNGIQE